MPVEMGLQVLGQHPPEVQQVALGPGAPRGAHGRSAGRPATSRLRRGSAGGGSQEDAQVRSRACGQSRDGIGYQSYSRFWDAGPTRFGSDATPTFSTLPATENVTSLTLMILWKVHRELVEVGILPIDYDFEAHKRLVPIQPGDVPVTYADTSALERNFGYKPAAPLVDLLC